MFAKRYFPNRYYAKRYWANTGGADLPPLVVSILLAADVQMPQTLRGAVELGRTLAFDVQLPGTTKGVTEA